MRSYIPLLSIGLFVFCVLTFPSAASYLDQTSSSSAAPCPFIKALANFTPSALHFNFPHGSEISGWVILFFGACSPFRTGKCFIGVLKNNEDKAGLCGGRNAFFNACEWMAPHIPQQQALRWMAALTRLFSLLTTALCLLATDRIIYLPDERGFNTRLTCWRADFKLFSFFPSVSDD